MSLISAPLYFVEAITSEGETVGVAMRPSPGCGFLTPSYVPKQEAARLHKTEAQKLRKRAIAHGMNAKTRLDRATLKPANKADKFDSVSRLLGSLLA